MAKSRRESQTRRPAIEPERGQAAHEMVARRTTGPIEIRAAPGFRARHAMAFGLHPCNRTAWLRLHDRA
jgi:hypothetical protein